MSKTIYVTQPSMPSLEEFVKELQLIWKSKWLTNRGAAHKKLENDLKAYLDARQVCLFANGHLALEIAISCLAPKGGEIITTPYTHCSTLHAIVRGGYEPVFCDVKEDDLTINPALIEEKITEKTIAIVATHVYGFLCDDDSISAIAKKHGLRVIYDAAHAFGVRINGISSANLGDAAMFSTHATKVMNTIEGGIVAFHDMELFGAMRQMVNFGFTSPDEVEHIGTNARMNELEAVMGICNLRRFDDDVAARKRAGDRYYERLKDKEELRLIDLAEGLRWNYAYMPVLVSGGKASRDALKEKLEKAGIFARKYFYPLVTDLACYAGRYGDLEFPVAAWAADSVLTLPIYSDLSIEDVDRICDAILS